METADPQIWPTLNIKHEYLRSRAYICLSLSSPEVTCSILVISSNLTMIDIFPHHFQSFLIIFQHFQLNFHHFQLNFRHFQHIFPLGFSCLHLGSPHPRISVINCEIPFMPDSRNFCNFTRNLAKSC